VPHAAPRTLYSRFTRIAKQPLRTADRQKASKGRRTGLPA
jgi:hypothetical protein